MVNDTGASSEAPDIIVKLEVQYRTKNEWTAQRWAARHAKMIFQEDDVEAVTVDRARPEQPITEMYLRLED